MNVDKTLVFGGPIWFGQLSLDSGSSANEAFEYFVTQAPGLGWQEITSVRARVSVLTFQRQDRIMSVQIEGTTLRGSDIIVTVSPRGASPGAAPAGRQPSAVQAPPQPTPLPQGPTAPTSSPQGNVLPPLSGPKRSPLLQPAPGTTQRNLFSN